MPFGFLRSKDASERLENVEAIVQRMFADDRHVFDLAMATLVGGDDPGTVRREIKSTDHRVNEGEREVRRELVVHASVVGAIDTPRTCSTSPATGRASRVARASRSSPRRSPG
jgi:hypothetical protein